MGNRAKLLLSLVCVLAIPAEAKSPNSFSNARQSATGSQPTGEIPFELVHSCLVVVRGSLNGVKGRNLLIDTGSDPSILDGETARMLGIHGGAADLVTLQGHIAADSALLSRVTVGPVTANSVPVLIADLSHSGKDIGIRIDAIVGLDVLKGADFVIDYRSQRIIFGPAPRYRDSIPFEIDPTFLVVGMEIEGKPKRFLVDTGAEGLFIFRTRNPTERIAANIMPRNSSHVSPGHNRVEVEIPEVRLGTLERKRQLAYVEDTPQPVSSELDGLLGPLSLGIFQVVFDFHHRKLGWNLDSDESAPWLNPSLGQEGFRPLAALSTNARRFGESSPYYFVGAVASF